MKILERLNALTAPIALLGVAAIVLAGSFAATAGGPSSKQPSTPNPSDKAKLPTVVLVHGAWADATGWADVTTSLQGKGFTVLSPPNPLRGLPSDTASLTSFLQARTDGPVVLVGHSYGGSVITNAARSDKDVKALVFVNAFAPAKGESVLQLLDPNHQLDPTTLFDFVPLPSGNPKAVDFYLKQAVFPGAFANGVDPAVATVMATAQRGITLRALDGASGAPAWKKLPSFYLVGTEDHIIPADLQRMMAERAGSVVVEVAAGHLSMITHPEDVSDLVVQASAATK